MTGDKKRSSGVPPVVIIGCGIIGLSTAYYLSLASSGRSITIVDNSSKLFTGASGKANGILGDYGFEPEAESLAKLSWELHQQLASMHRGRTAWGYRDVMIYDLHREASSDPSEVVKGSRHPQPPFPSWCKTVEEYASTLIPKNKHAARMQVSPTVHQFPNADY